MCGIAGIWAPRLATAERVARVHDMLHRMRHRGPSGIAVWSDDEITLGLARLAIVAPRNAARTLANEDGSVHVVANGEIYDYRPLREALRRRGHRIADGVDTELLPHLFEERGAGFPEAIDGMFAVAVWDAARRRLVLARDRAGEKPLFVASWAGGRAFASEPGALAALPWISRDPSPGALGRYLVHGGFAGEDCAFAAVTQLPPAHVFELGVGIERRHRYWRPWDALPAPREPRRGAREAPAATREALERAVESRVPADVPFGVFLSGGVDSSLVAVLAARRRGGGFPTFSLRFPDRGYDESAFARDVAALIGSVHHELTMDVAAGREAIERFARGMDQPLGDPSLLPTWALARVAARHVPVVLTGEGGDELFAGYPTYLGHRFAGSVRHLPRAARTALLALVRRLRPAHHHVTVAHLVERLLGAAALMPFERHLAWFGTARAAEARALLAPAIRRGLDEDAPLAHLDRVAAALEGAPVGDLRRDPKLVAYQILDFELYLGGDLLPKVDRCTMAHAVEARAPFLQHDLIDFALALPARAKLRGTCSKWALKRAARGLLPERLLGRRKQGFSPPFSAWVRGPLRHEVEGWLSPERIERAGVLDAGTVRSLLADHVANRVERGRTLWALLSLQMWAERWLGAAPAAESSAPAAVEAVRPG
ncbi:MAG: asparagine synthase (glutamine-hydrolyzing) [Candidatus Eisenbacteria bacterium RBG_19FT_COMBO_70_11]|nr:MAG: asparagine synthase (glutamine-hydrolyzing) [Candidatus Eisenbacteria bacterium RBG_19FT_COMBO_70_11]